MGDYSLHFLVWLKVLTNEKKDGLKMVSFDRSLFKFQKIGADPILW